MSTLWTPSGEHRIPPPPPDGQAGGRPAEKTSAPRGTGLQEGGRQVAPDQGRQPGGAGTAGGAEAQAGASWEPTAEEVQQAEAELDAMREQLARAPVEVVIANHAMGLWELAALHLSQKPPQFPQARLAIDALATLVEGLKGRLGEPEKSLQDGLAQIRMAYVQIHGAEPASQSASQATDGPSASGP